MHTRRFNWIILLVGGVGCVAVGFLGVAAGDPLPTAGWFAFGVGLIGGAIVLKRMRLP